jgi:outer membrane protein insertion porin family
VTVAEGPEFKLGEVQFAGKYVAKSAQLQKVAKFKIGETANFDEISSGIVRIQKSLERQGYIRVTTSVDRAVHEKTKTVDITIHIEEGPLFTMGKLTVEGLDLNGEAGIRKLWATKEGQPFDAEYPDYFMNRVREDGLFDNLHNNKASTKVDEQNHTVDVTLRFH